DKATNPLNKEQDWDSIRAFCEQLNKDLEGPQLATRLLAHKIQSPQEWEAMQALTVLETCMKNCGKRFHSEVGKFRFLNELIKVVSPKYLGTRAPEKVKSKVLELMYSWTVGLPDEVKISDAYQMLKKQALFMPCPSSLPAPTLFLSLSLPLQMLARLLNSTHPEDLRAANKLIKEMVQEDQRRMERISKRVNAIEEVNSNVRLLTDLLHGYSHDTTTPSNEELIKELYQRCEKMRPTLFRLASDTEDNDEALAEILQANDNLTQVINMYKQVVKGEEVNGESTAMPKMTGSSSALLDLTGLDTSVTTPSYPAFPNLSAGQPAPPPEAGLSLLDDELMSLGNRPPPHCSGTFLWFSPIPFLSPAPPSFPSLSCPVPALLLPRSRCLWVWLGSPGGSVTESRPLRVAGLNDPAPGALSQPADSTGWNSFQVSGGVRPGQTGGTRVCRAGARGSWVAGRRPPERRQLIRGRPVPFPFSPRERALRQGAPLQPDISLANVTVPLESIKPSSILPVTVFDKHSFRVLFHFARDCPPSRPDVLVVVISMISTAPVPVRNIVFQSAVPKVMKVKLQPPSGTELPAFNPIVPPVAITQVLLLANPHKEKVRLRYKLTFTMGEETHNEIGDVEQFPPPENWGKL
ncbi:GGA1 protein, partial [Atractosteus spatula]|nr:GGA1 protein [Atractosteus spatula]